MAGNVDKSTSTDIFTGKGNALVGQDKDAHPRINAASPQPRIPAVPANMHTSRPKRHGSQKRQTVEIGVCLSPQVKEELERLQDQGGGKPKLSLSKVAAQFIDQGVQSHIDMQYGALLRPVIEAAIRKEMQSLSNRSASLSANAFYAAEQARILCITVLSLLLGQDTAVLPGLIAQSQKQAHENLKRHMWQEEEETPEAGEAAP